MLTNLLFAAVVSLLFASRPGVIMRTPAVESYLAGIARVWTLTATMASFTLSFFLSQSYALWRSVYSVTRRVQGRLNDVGLLASTFAQRDSDTGTYTPEAQELLRTISRYVRLFSMLFYASVSTRFAPLGTPQGLTALGERGALTVEVRSQLSILADVILYSYAWAHSHIRALTCSCGRQKAIPHTCTDPHTRTSNTHIEHVPTLLLVPPTLLLFQQEREVLLQSSMGHNAVIGWLSVLIDTAVKSPCNLATGVYYLCITLYSHLS